MKALTSWILAGLIVLAPTLALATGSVTITQNNYGDGAVRSLTFAWVGDSSTGVVPTGTISAANAAHVAGYWLCMADVKTTVAHRPTASYNIYIADAANTDTSAVNDLFGGGMVGMDSNGTSANFVPTIKSGGMTGLGCKFVTGSVQFKLSGNSVGSAAGTVKLWFVKP